MCESPLFTELKFHYGVFGLSLHSNLQIPWLVPGEVSPIQTIGPRVEMHLGVLPPIATGAGGTPEQLVYTSRYVNESGEPSHRAWRVGDGSFLRLSYSNGMQFWLNNQGSEVWADWPETSSIQDTASYLLGPVLGVLLRLRGTVCIHASAVAVANRVVAFVGPAGAGKSTTAAIFARRGCAVLSDDIVALVDEGRTISVLPAYPHLCLWPDSVNKLYGSADYLPRFVSNWEKRYLALDRDELKFERRTLQLGTIYLLENRAASSEARIECASLQTAFMALVANSYATHILDPQMRAKEFDVFGRLVPLVPIRYLRAPRNANRFQDLYDCVCRDLKGIEP